MAGLPETFVPGFHDENEVKKMQYSVLGKTGLKVSKLAFGTGAFCFAYGTPSLEECKRMLIMALKKGINYIDTAPYYGQGESEEIVGKCLEGIPRKAYYIATKVGRYGKTPSDMFDFSAKKTEQSINDSLKRLKLDYVDILQVHDVEFASSVDIVLNETLPAVEKIVKQGKAKYIGVTGYPVRTLSECIEKSQISIDLVLSYSRLTMFDDTLKQYLPGFKSKNLGVVNAAVNGLALLTNQGERQWHEATAHLKEVCKEAREICKKNNVELGKLAVWHSLQQEGPDITLVGISSMKVLEDNLEVLFKGISDKEKKVYDEVMEVFKNKLTERHWENLEVERYWKNVKNLQ